MFQGGNEILVFQYLEAQFQNLKRREKTLLSLDMQGKLQGTIANNFRALARP